MDTGGPDQIWAGVSEREEEEEGGLSTAWRTSDGVRWRKRVLGILVLSGPVDWQVQVQDDCDGPHLEIGVGTLSLLWESLT